MPEQGTQAPSPAPDLIPAETQKINSGTHIEVGTANGGTSPPWAQREVGSQIGSHLHQRGSLSVISDLKSISGASTTAASVTVTRDE